MRNSASMQGQWKLIVLVALFGSILILATSIQGELFVGVIFAVVMVAGSAWGISYWNGLARSLINGLCKGDDSFRIMTDEVGWFRRTLHAENQFGTWEIIVGGRSDLLIYGPVQITGVAGMSVPFFRSWKTICDPQKSMETQAEELAKKLREAAEN